MDLKMLIQRFSSIINNLYVTIISLHPYIKWYNPLAAEDQAVIG